MNNLVQPVKKQAVRTALRVSGTHETSIYNLGNADRENGYYFIFEGLEVPFRAILDSNNKINGILGVFFGTAKDCPSQALGLCQLPSDSICYARAGESRATRKNNEDGSKGMDSYFKGTLASYFWDTFESSEDIKARFMDFLTKNGIQELRFNLKGDFRHERDIIAMFELANAGFKCVCYTARDDLQAVLETITDHPNIIINGSNRMYTNRFKATASLKEYLEAENRCIGSCKACKKCYTLRGRVITCLIHGAGSDTLLNTPENQQFILDWSKNGALGLDWLRDTDFKACKGLMACINKELKRIGLLWRPKNIKALLKEIEERGY